MVDRESHCPENPHFRPKAVRETLDSHSMLCKRGVPNDHDSLRPGSMSFETTLRCSLANRLTVAVLIPLKFHRENAPAKHRSGFENWLWPTPRLDEAQDLSSRISKGLLIVAVRVTPERKKFEQVISRIQCLVASCEGFDELGE